MKKSFFFLPLLLALASCEEVIQLELDTAEQRVVVEANLDAAHGTCTVSLSKSGDFYESNSFEKVVGASISLSTSAGGEVLLTDLGNGRYAAQNIAFNPAETHRLRIALPDGQVIESSEVASPVAVALDSLLLEKSVGGGTGGPGGGGTTEDQYSLTAQWKDPAGMENFYRLKIYRNGEFQSSTYILTDDRLGDGEPISRPVIRQTFEKGDTLRCQLLSVSKGYYDYFTDLANSEGRGFSAPTPYNPKGNLTGEALGYFGVWFVSEKTIVVQ